MFSTFLEGRDSKNIENRPSRKTNMTKEKSYISLKEAAKMSGYSPDYVGQLIRAGKISGKQVYSNISWVTTEEAILDYLQKEKKGKASLGDGTYKVKDLVFTPETIDRAYAIVAWSAIVLLGIFIIFLVSVFAISADHKIENRYLLKAASQIAH